MTNTRPIATTGEVFADRATIELIGGGPDGKLGLMLWDGAKETVGARVEHHGQLYEPPPINSSVLQELTLPAECCPHGTTRELLPEICELVRNLAGLSERPASMVIPGFLIIYDQSWREYRTSISLWTDRAQKSAPHSRSWTRRKGGLLDRRDPIPRG